MTKEIKKAQLEARLVKAEQKNPTSGVVRKLKREISNLSK